MIAMIEDCYATFEAIKKEATNDIWPVGIRASNSGAVNHICFRNGSRIYDKEVANESPD